MNLAFSLITHPCADLCSSGQADRAPRKWCARGGKRNAACLDESRRSDTVPGTPDSYAARSREMQRGVEDEGREKETGRIDVRTEREYISTPIKDR